MRILTVVGNRPQFVKAAAVSRHLRQRADEVLVHTGQHYDHQLSAIFFEELGLPPPDHQLGVGSGSHAEQTAATMERLEPLVGGASADAVLVYGDTNATLAAALVAAKLPVPLAHVEAGMRCFDLSMPEEVNRIVADSLAGLLLCSTETAVENLRVEGARGRIRLVGDVMADVTSSLGPLAERRSDVRRRLGLGSGAYLLATVHRSGTTDDRERLEAAVGLLLAAARRGGPLVWPLHPRTRARLEAQDLLAELEREPAVILAEPLGYLDFACLLRGARAVLTDSGGLQKEAYLTAVPCITLREETEWVETVERGGNELVGLDRELALGALERALDGGLPEPDPLLYGAGDAGERCARELLAWLAARSR